MRIKKYLRKKVKSRYNLYKQERRITKKAREEMRRDVLKVKLKTRKEQAIKVAREGEIIKAKRKLQLLKKPYTRGYGSFFAKPIRLPKARKTKKRKKKRKWVKKK